MRALQNVYERVLWLAQQCYPDYDNTGRMKNGPVVAMRVGDLFQYRVGIIKNLSYDWLFNAGKWETTAGVRMPQGCTVTMSYQVIHETNPTRDLDFYAGSSAFDVFSETTTSSVGYGEEGRFIHAGQTANADDLDEHPYLDNSVIGGENFLENLQKIPIGLDGTEVAYSDSYPDNEVN